MAAILMEGGELRCHT